MPLYAVHLHPDTQLKRALRETLAPLPVHPIAEHRLHTTVIYFPAADRQKVHDAVSAALPPPFPLYIVSAGTVRNGIGSKLILGFDYSPQFDMFHASVVKRMLESRDEEFARTYRSGKYQGMRPHMVVARAECGLEAKLDALSGYRWDVREVTVMEGFELPGKRFDLTTARASPAPQGRRYR